ncbi:flagellar assembly protein FliH [Mangrovibacter plantisponsor]|uniref:Flagellar assembly protein FliH n=1 Tax=Mangrovibacter plantisponsor TaxID=451513 RepID=A0A317PNN2_9ENTR|nr:flagellar assembly protein FliH [Mangrovibacter plantisponsor]PWW00832.1 flagellar assembly protein FliH [Mangrovibacter plantisponsor]
MEKQPRQAVIRPRRYQFPPLRPAQPEHAPTDAGQQGITTQQQLSRGYNDGMNQGFARGLEEGQQEGYQEGVRLGFEEGMRKGLAEGKRLARQQFDDTLSPLDNAHQAVNRFLAGFEQQRRTELLQLVEKVTRQVIRCELALQPTQLLALVEEALSGLAGPPGQIRVQMNPEEFTRIQDTLPEKVLEWGLCAEATLAAGECRVITEQAEIDIGCAHRLDHCMDTLKSTLLPEQPHETE